MIPALAGLSSPSFAGLSPSLSGSSARRGSAVAALRTHQAGPGSRCGRSPRACWTRNLWGQVCPAALETWKVRRDGHRRAPNARLPPRNEHSETQEPEKEHIHPPGSNHQPQKARRPENFWKHNVTQKLPLGCNSTSLCFQESFEKPRTSYSDGHSCVWEWDKNTHTEQLHLMTRFSLRCPLLPSVTLAQLHDALPSLSVRPRGDATAGP